MEPFTPLEPFGTPPSPSVNCEWHTTNRVSQAPFLVYPCLRTDCPQAGVHKESVPGRGTQTPVTPKTLLGIASHLFLNPEPSTLFGQTGKELGLYLLMALTNLANGRDALKGVLLNGGAVGAAGAALERWGLAGGRSVGMQVISLFWPVCRLYLR